MPVYEYACDVCKIKWELKLTMKEHSAIKDQVHCLCGQQAYQVVSPLNFRLAGEGWFGRDGGNNAKGLGYEMTQREMTKSIQDVAKMDDVIANMAAKDENRSEL